MTSLAEEVVRDKKTLDYLLDQAQSGPATHVGVVGSVYIGDAVDAESNILYGRGQTNALVIRSYGQSMAACQVTADLSGYSAGADDLAPTQ